METTSMRRLIPDLQAADLQSNRFDVGLSKLTLRDAALRVGALLALAASCQLGTVNAQAQTVYRVIGADGRVTFSDKPPLSTDKAGDKAGDKGSNKAGEKVTATDRAGRTVDLSGTALPFELRQTASRYPVTLYSASNCSPCANGRSFLSARGIPFVERTVNTPEDAEALTRISGEASLPFLTVGGQKIKGYSDAEWTQYLDAAGYPSASKLPSNYRNSVPAPLVALQKPATPVQADAFADPTRAPTAPPPARVDNSSNPAGIRF